MRRGKRSKPAERGHVNIYLPRIPDYHSPGFYLLLFRKSFGGPELFGTLQGDARVSPRLHGGAFVCPSRLGKIFTYLLHQWELVYPQLLVYDCQLMPDHIHVLLKVRKRLEYHFTHYIGQLLQWFEKYTNLKSNSSDSVYSLKYFHKPLTGKYDIEAYQLYLRSNPHRLAMRLQYPIFFQTVRHIPVAGKKYEAYGNLFLFRNPDKLLVRIEDDFSLWKRNELRKALISGSEKGSILVSPFLTEEEKRIRQETYLQRGSIILVTHEAMGRNYRPQLEEDYVGCCCRWLMIISLGYPEGTPLSAEIEEELYELADKIAASN